MRKQIFRNFQGRSMPGVFKHTFKEPEYLKQSEKNRGDFKIM